MFRGDSLIWVNGLASRTDAAMWAIGFRRADETRQRFGAGPLRRDYQRRRHMVAEIALLVLSEIDRIDETRVASIRTSGHEVDVKGLNGVEFGLCNSAINRMTARPDGETDFEKIPRISNNLFARLYSPFSSPAALRCRILDQTSAAPHHP